MTDNDDQNDETEQQQRIGIFSIAVVGAILMFCASHFMGYLSFEEVSLEEAEETWYTFAEDQFRLTSQGLRNFMTAAFNGTNVFEMDPLKLKDLGVSTTYPVLIFLALAAWATFTRMSLAVRILGWFKWGYTGLLVVMLIFPWFKPLQMTFREVAIGLDQPKSWAERAMVGFDRFASNNEEWYALFLAMTDYHQSTMLVLVLGVACVWVVHAMLADQE